MRTVRLVLVTVTTALAVFAADAVIAAQPRDKPATVTFTIEGMT